MSNKPNKVDFLEEQARTMVGDGQQPNLYFVTDDYVVIAIMTEKDDAIEYAKEVDRGMVEDRLTGVVWECRAIELEKRAEIE